jgi:hypothetical protein
VLRAREPIVVAISIPVPEERSTRQPVRASAGCTVVYSGDRPTVWIVGQVDRVTINQVSGVIRGLRGVGIRHLAIDMSAALNCDGRLLTVLARAHTELADVNGELTIVGLRLPQVLAALRTATLNEAFVVYDSLRPPPKKAEGKRDSVAFPGSR